jgi:apolipoprotein N-acyltransferase
LFTWTTNLTIARAIACRKPSGAVLALLLALLLTWPDWNSWLCVPGDGPDIKVAFIQSQSRDLQTLVDFSADAAKDGAELILWPELSAEQIVTGGDTEQLVAVSRRSAPFMTTFRDGDGLMPHNALSLFKDGTESARYFKQKPFGGERNLHTPGREPLTIPTKLSNLDVRIGCTICFDSCFPLLMRRTADSGKPNLLVSPSLDPPSSTGFAQAIHAAFSPFRAVELGMPIIRSESTAFSQLVQPNGIVILSAPLGFEGQMSGTIKLGNRDTIYRRVGDAVLWLSGIFVMIGFLGHRRLVKSPLCS